MSIINNKHERAYNDYYESVTERIRSSERFKLGLFIGPAMAIMSFFLIFPLLYTILLSFSTEFPMSFEFTLENYTTIANTDAYIAIIYRTAVLTLQITVVTVVVGYAMAYALAMFTKRAKIALLGIIIPFWVNYLVRNWSIFAIFQNGGAFDTIMNVIPFITSTPDILFTRAAVLLGLGYSFLPVAILPMYASIANMDKSLINAAKDLGAGPIKTFVTVTLPQTLSGVYVGILLVMIPSFGAFVTPAMLGGSDETMIGTLIELQYMTVFDLPMGSAIAVFTSVIALSILVITTKMSGVPLVDDE